MTSKYKQAWQEAKALIDILKDNWIAYQGKVDVTERLNFATIAGDFALTQRQYDALINKAQKYFDGMKNETPMP